MADNAQNDSSWSLSGLLSGLSDVAKNAGEAYAAWTGASRDADEENAYMRGQLAAIEANQKAQDASGYIEIGDAVISTSSILWIIGGTIGLLAIGLGFKKLLK